MRFAFRFIIFTSVLLELIIFFFEVNSEKANFRKINYFLIFNSIMKNKLENIFQYLVMS